MNELVRERCELLATNRAVMRKKFAFEDNLLCVTGSLIFTLEGKEADAEKLAGCKKILAKQTGLFSKLRSMAELVVLSKMALSDDPEKLIEDLKTVCEKVRKAKFKEDPYMVLACLLICDLGLQDDCDEIISRAAEIMGRMDKEHPFLTSSEDTTSVMLLALSYKNVDTIISELEEGYRYLKETPKLSVSGNAAQNLCEVLVVSYGDIKTKCDKVVKIRKAFKNLKSDFGSAEELATIAALVDEDMSPEALAAEIIEASDFLKSQKGFEDGSINAGQRTMYVTLLAAGVYGKGSNMMSGPAISNSFSVINAKRIASTISIVTNLVSGVISGLIEDSGKKEQEEK